MIGITQTQRGGLHLGDQCPKVGISILFEDPHEMRAIGIPEMFFRPAETESEALDRAAKSAGRTKLGGKRIDGNIERVDAEDMCSELRGAGLEIVHLSARVMRGTVFKEGRDGEERVVPTGKTFGRIMMTFLRKEDVVWDPERQTPVMEHWCEQVLRGIDWHVTAVWENPLVREGEVVPGCSSGQILLKHSGFKSEEQPPKSVICVQGDGALRVVAFS